MTETEAAGVRERQDPLRARYRAAPEAAITDRARSTGGVETNPFHGQVVPGSKDYGTVPVGFQNLRCHVDVQAAEGTEPKLMKKLFAAAEHSCVVLQTLRSGVSVETSVSGV